jgi:hypothetical protein
VRKGALAWYVENPVFKHQQILDLKHKVVHKVSPLLDDMLADIFLDSMVTAPIASHKRWKGFAPILPEFHYSNMRPGNVVAIL